MYVPCHSVPDYIIEINISESEVKSLTVNNVR